MLEAGCRLTGVTDRRFLRAIHIKPWSRSDSREKLDGNNGLLIAPHIDHLFDKGFISFEDDGSVMTSKSLTQSVQVA
jgi:predicted restriction endonuclease